MAWYSKEQPTPLDDLQINGLCLRIGDMDALKHGCDWFEGHKKPMLALPATTLPLEYGSDEGLSVSLGGVAYIPVFVTAHEALYFLTGFRLFNCAVFEVFNDDHQIEVYASEQQRIYFINHWCGKTRLKNGHKRSQCDDSKIIKERLDDHRGYYYHDFLLCR